MRSLSDASLAYVLLRVAFGLNLAMHGVNRLLLGVGLFATKLGGSFAGTFLPQSLVRAFASVLPFCELTIGLLLLVGLRLRWVLTAGALLMLVLMFGTALVGNWNVLAVQLLYVLTYYLLLLKRSDDAWSWDASRRHA